MMRHGRKISSLIDMTAAITNRMWIINILVISNTRYILNIHLISHWLMRNSWIWTGNMRIEFGILAFIYSWFQTITHATSIFTHICIHIICIRLNIIRHRGHRIGLIINWIYITILDIHRSTTILGTHWFTIWDW